MAKKETSGLEIIENAEVLKDKINNAESFVEKNNKLFMIIGAGLLALVAAFYGYKYWSASKEKEAQAAMYDSVFSFEADSLKQALKGSGGNEGLVAVSEEFSGTKAGKLASFYAGVAYIKQGKFKEAIEKLEKYNLNDQVLQAKAYCLIGDAHLELKSSGDAIKYYEKAVEYQPNKFLTPVYMMKLANAQIESKNTKGAIEVYSSLLEKYPNSNQVQMAKKYKAQLEAALGQ